MGKKRRSRESRESKETMEVDNEPIVKVKQEPMDEQESEDVPNLEPKEPESNNKQVPMDSGDSKRTENDENDPVVKEIPVFLSKTLAENLLLFQVNF